MTEAALLKVIGELFQEGRAKALKAGRSGLFARAMLTAVKATWAQPESEARIICADLAESIFVEGMLTHALRRMGQLDEPRCRFGQIELQNGSCIRVLAEDAEAQP